MVKMKTHPRTASRRGVFYNDFETGSTRRRGLSFVVRGDGASRLWIFFLSLLPQNDLRRQVMQTNFSKIDTLTVSRKLKEGIEGYSRSVQEIWGASAETCLVPFFHLVPPLFVTSQLANERRAKWIILPIPCANNQIVTAPNGNERHNWVTFFWLVDTIDMYTEN